MVLKLSKIVSLLQFFANVSKLAIYVYVSEGSRFTPLGNGVGFIML